LLLAVNHPDLVRTLVLAEPPLVPWLEDLPGDRAKEGKRLITDLHNRFLTPAREALDRGEADTAVGIFFDYAITEGAYAPLPAATKAQLTRNSLEFVAEVTSKDTYPPLTREQVRRLTIPTLMLSGAKSAPLSRLIDDELERVLPDNLCQRVPIPNATHAMWYEDPKSCGQAVLEFISNR
jgi:pimeloyl-ACP methyl ester carboxylesterase